MNRKKFLKNSTLGLGSIIAIPSLITSCKKDEDFDPTACVTSAEETAGPFPIKSPADWVRENIIGNRAGVPLMIVLTIQNTNNSCMPLEGALVDVWHCDAQGNYSEYAGQLDGDFTGEHFLRGRQTSDANGNASFMSIYPGWYPGRTPHIHAEVKSSTGASLLITQISFPEAISSTVYGTAAYNDNGNADTNNANDGIVSAANLAEVTGNTTDGYTLTKTIKVAG